MGVSAVGGELRGGLAETRCWSCSGKVMNGIAMKGNQHIWR